MEEDHSCGLKGLMVFWEVRELSGHEGHLTVSLKFMMVEKTWLFWEFGVKVLIFKWPVGNFELKARALFNSGS